MTEKVLIPTEMNRVASYVRIEADCDPGIPILLDNDPICPVWKVPVLTYSMVWEVAPPEFWYVCTGQLMNLYRSDLFNLENARPDKEDELKDNWKELLYIDYIKSFHLGIAVRLMVEGDNDDGSEDDDEPEVS